MKVVAELFLDECAREATQTLLGGCPKDIRTSVIERSEMGLDREFGSTHEGIGRPSDGLTLVEPPVLRTGRAVARVAEGIGRPPDGLTLVEPSVLRTAAARLTREAGQRRSEGSGLALAYTGDAARGRVLTREAGQRRSEGSGLACDAGGRLELLDGTRVLDGGRHITVFLARARPARVGGRRSTADDISWGSGVLRTPSPSSDLRSSVRLAETVAVIRARTIESFTS